MLNLHRTCRDNNIHTALANITIDQDFLSLLTISVFDALSIGSGLVAAVLLCIKRGQIEKNNIHRLILSPNSKIYNDSQ